MTVLNSRWVELGVLDRLSCQDTPIHRLDPRAKLLTTLAFIVAVVSFGKYDLSALLPFLIYPISLAALGNLPARFLLRRMAMVAPFALVVGLFNPLLDRETLVRLGPWSLSGGWISFCSILLRFSLTVSAALVLLGSTGIHGVCVALDKLGTPRAFTVQLLFMYRYLFVLVEEALRVLRATALRSFGRRPMTLRVYGSIIGQLLLRTMDRAHRIHAAMCCRGFDGRVRLTHASHWRFADAAFVLCWSGAFLFLRLVHVPRWLGVLITGAAT